MKRLFRLAVINGLTLALITFLLPQVRFASTWVLISAAAVLAVLTILVRPALKILFLPVNLVTFGLFSWFINVIVLWLATVLVPGFHIGAVTTPEFALGPFLIRPVELSELWSFILVSFVLSLGNGVLGSLL